MKSIIFSSAIFNRNRIKFLYNLSEVVIDPYYISVNKNGKKVIYGKVNGMNEVRMFEYDRISNIKILGNNKFSPVIPILPRFN